MKSNDVIQEDKSDRVELLPETKLDQEIGSINDAILDDDKTEEATNEDKDAHTVKENDVIDNKDDLTEKLVSESSLECSQNPAQHNNHIEENDTCQELKMSPG